MNKKNEMMKFDLFHGEKVCLAPIDLEHDPEIISRWSHDSYFLRQMGLKMAQPISPTQAKKELEEIEKEAEKSGRLYHFTIRMLQDDRLIGTARIEWIEWSTRSGWVVMGIGSPKDRGNGYGTDTMRMLLRYTFHELNLFRLAVGIPGYNEGAQRFFQRFGFTCDARLREAVHRFGRRWDLLMFALLQDEWEQHAAKEE